MALSLREAVELQERNIVGIPLRRTEILELQAEVAVLKQAINQRDETITLLRGELTTWQTRSLADNRAAFERERQLVSVIHRQMGEIQLLHDSELARATAPPVTEPEIPRRKGWFRRR